ncbi:MAG: hypothetical protein IJU23_06785 [Proteobacteria bacterium]|nr:hypothetical protein [Pseudomonadota bacterium]
MKNLYVLSIILFCLLVSGCKSSGNNAPVENAVSNAVQDDQAVESSSDDGEMEDWQRYNDLEYDDDGLQYDGTMDDEWYGTKNIPECEQWPADACTISPELAMDIIERGAVNEVNVYKQVPLMWVRDPDSMRKLIAAGANVNARDENLMTPLMYAETLEAMKILVDNGAEVNATDDEGRTALFYVESVEAAKGFLTIGVDPSIRDKYGKTCLEVDGTDTSILSIKAVSYIHQALYE